MANSYFGEASAHEFTANLEAPTSRFHTCLENAIYGTRINYVRDDVNGFNMSHGQAMGLKAT
jgi:hypothetical protein